MAVVGQAEEVAGKRGPKMQNNRRQYFRRFKVLVDSKHDGPFTVLSAGGLPVQYSQYITTTEFDPGAVCLTLDPEQDKKLPLLWWVDVNYDTEYERKDDNPFAEPPEIEFDFDTYQEPLPGAPLVTYSNPYDVPASNSAVDPLAKVVRFGAGITNSAGEPFDPPATRESSRPVVRFSRNEPNFFPSLAVKFVNSVNQFPWSGLEARVAMIKGIKASFQYRKFNTVGKADIPYFKVSYQFALKRETWDLELLNIGTYYLSAAATFTQDGAVSNAVAKVPNVIGGRPVKVLLNADGTKLTTGANPTFRRFRVAPERNFAELGIALNLDIDQLKPRK